MTKGYWHWLYDSIPSFELKITKDDILGILVMLGFLYGALGLLFGFPVLIAGFLKQLPMEYGIFLVISGFFSLTYSIYILSEDC